MPVALPLYYNWRNLRRRKLSTALTFVVVAVVVVVLCVLLSFTAGIQASLMATGSNLNLIVLKPGATAESTSVLLPDEVGRLLQTPGLARSPDGAASMSRELRGGFPRGAGPGNRARPAAFYPRRRQQYPGERSRL